MIEREPSYTSLQGAISQLLDMQRSHNELMHRTIETVREENRTDTQQLRAEICALRTEVQTRRPMPWPATISIGIILLIALTVVLRFALGQPTEVTDLPALPPQSAMMKGGNTDAMATGDRSRTGA